MKTGLILLLCLLSLAVLSACDDPEGSGPAPSGDERPAATDDSGPMIVPSIGSPKVGGMTLTPYGPGVSIGGGLSLVP